MVPASVGKEEEEPEAQAALQRLLRRPARGGEGHNRPLEGHLAEVVTPAARAAAGGVAVQVMES